MQCKPHAHLIFLLAQVRSLPPSHQTSLLSTAPCSCEEKCMEAQILARLASCMKPADYLAAALAGRMKPFVSRLRCSSWREAFCQHFPSCSHGCARVRTHTHTPQSHAKVKVITCKQQGLENIPRRCQVMHAQLFVPIYEQESSEACIKTVQHPVDGKHPATNKQSPVDGFWFRNSVACRNTVSCQHVFLKRCPPLFCRHRPRGNTLCWEATRRSGDLAGPVPVQKLVLLCDIY